MLLPRRREPDRSFLRHLLDVVTRDVELDVISKPRVSAGGIMGYADNTVVYTQEESREITWESDRRWLCSEVAYVGAGSPVAIY